MTDSPETRYTRSADGTNLAFQVSGDGPLELVFLAGNAIPIDLLSEDPGFVRLRKRLESFSRAMCPDSRGLGASEGDPRDLRIGRICDDDLTALLDAVGFQRPALVADTAAGRHAIHFSVTHPDRVSALVLVNSYAHYIREDGLPLGCSSRQHRTDRGRRQTKLGDGRGRAGPGPQPGRRRALPSLVRPLGPVHRWPRSGRRHGPGRDRNRRSPAPALRVGFHPGLAS